MIEVAIVLCLVAYLYWAWPRLKQHFDTPLQLARPQWDDFDSGLTPADRAVEIDELERAYKRAAAKRRH